MAIPILLSIAASLWLWLTVTAAGEGILWCAGAASRSRGLAMLYRFGLGFGLTGTVIMVLCFAQRATPVGIVGSVGVLTAAGVPFWRRVIGDGTALLATAWREYLRPHPVAGGLLLLIVAGYACRGLLPPTEFDALMYHLPVVKLYLRHGGFWNVYFNAQANYPMLTEMTDMIGLALGNDIICKTMSFVLSLHAFLAVGLVARRMVGCSPHATIMALLIFGSGTTIIANGSTCYVDIPQALWTLLGLLALDEYRSDNRLRWLVVSALFAGMAIETKVFGIFVLPVLAVELFFMRERWKTAPGYLGRLALVVLPALVMGIPWFAKSLAYSGTILSIHHDSIVGQGLGRPMQVATASPVAAFLVNVPLRLLAAPWTFSLFPSQHQSDTFGPLLLCVLPFLIFVKPRTPARFLLRAALVYLAGVVVMEMAFIQGGSSIRYSTIVFMIGTAFVPWTVQNLKGHPAVATLLRFMVLITVVLGTLLFFKRYFKDWTALAMNQSRDAYYSAVLPEYAVIKTVNALADGKSVMPVYNYSDYLIEAPFVTAYRSYPSIEAMEADLRSKNVGYVFANNRLDTAENAHAFPELAHKEIIASKNGYYLYKLLW
jgi:hypothetical protein